MNESIKVDETVTPPPVDKPHHDSAGSATRGTEPKKTHEIQIELVYGDSRKPVARNPYRVTMPDGVVVSGFLDDKGFACVSGK